MALLEAMAAGTPALVTAESTIDGLAEAGGAVVSSAEFEEFGARLAAVLALSRGDLQVMGARAREFGRSRFTLEKVRDELLALYAELRDAVLK